MADPVNFINSYANNIQQLVSLLQTLQLQNLQLSDDATLVTNYFKATQLNGRSAFRSDIAAQDVANAQAALVQMLFTFNSGSPTQASYLLKMMP
jgi:hypothetical protein